MSSVQVEAASVEPTAYRIGVKLCGIRTVEAARSAVEARADYIGLVFAPSRRQVSPDEAREIVATLRAEEGERENGRAVRFVGVFVNARPAEIGSVVRYVGLDVVQLSGRESPEDVREIERPVFKAVHIGNGEHEAEAARQAPTAEMLLLDTYSPAAGEEGGVGRTFDWSLAAQLVLARRYRVMLAGGLTPENVGEAVRTVRPAAVDVSSGIETDGQKDPRKMAAFVHAAREAANNLSPPRQAAGDGTVKRDD